MTFKIDTAALAAGLAHMPLMSLGLAQPPSVTASFKCRQPQLQLAALEMLLVHNACVRELLAATVNVH